MAYPRLFLYTFASCLALTLAGMAAAADHPPDPAAIDALVQDSLKAWKVPGAALAIVYRGKVFYLKGHGVRELGARGAVTPHTVFPLASCSKAFTTTALAMLVSEGKIDWDDLVRKHLPAFRLADPLADAYVTIRDLLSMRTGVDSHDLLWYRSPWPQDEIIRRIGLVSPSLSFRSGYQYQSIMVMAAGRALEKASGSTWQEYVDKRIVRPIGMEDISFTTTPALKRADHSSGHHKDKDGIIAVRPWYPQTVPDSAGSVNASAADLSKWLLFHLGEGAYRGKKLLAAGALEETHSPQVIMRLYGSDRAFQPFTHQMSYGMGWVVQDYRGQHLVSHGGAVDGFRAHLTLVPDAQLGIALLNNLESAQMNLAISNTLVDLFLDLTPQDWNDRFLEVLKKEEEGKKEGDRQRAASQKKGTRPSLALDAYAGTYESPAYGAVRIELKDGKLRWSWSTFHGPLEHFHYDTFTARSEFLDDPFIVFGFNATGRVLRLRFLDMDFKKTKP